MSIVSRVELPRFPVVIMPTQLKEIVNCGRRVSATDRVVWGEMVCKFCFAVEHHKPEQGQVYAKGLSMGPQAGYEAKWPFLLP